jgi:hypothetical protein
VGDARFDEDELAGLVFERRALFMAHASGESLRTQHTHSSFTIS